MEELKKSKSPFEINWPLVGKKVEIDRQRLFVVKHGAMKWVLGVNILCKFDCGVSSIVALGKISDYHKEAKVVCQYIGVFIM